MEGAVGFADALKSRIFVDFVGVLPWLREPSSLQCSIEWIGRKPLFWPPCPPRQNAGKTMRHIISILLQNEAGALTRVASLFSTRGYNIESLTVAPTDDPTVRASRW